MTVRAKKTLGQHFLLDPNICRKIVAFSGLEIDHTAVEIGPGTGSLTRRILEVVPRLTAIEFDAQLTALLQRQIDDGHWKGLQVIQGDALKIDWSERLDDAGGLHLPPGRLLVLGNLPYNIASRLLQRMSAYPNRFHALTFMLQKEVADRVAAPPGGSDYGFLSLIMQYHFEVVKGFKVGPGAFRPAPKVQSHVLKMLPRRPAADPQDAQRFRRLVSLAFRFRRKTLFNNLAGAELAGDPRRAIEQCGLAADVRPQQVSLQQFRCLARVL